MSFTLADWRKSADFSTNLQGTRPGKIFFLGSGLRIPYHSHSGMFGWLGQINTSILLARIVIWVWMGHGHVCNTQRPVYSIILSIIWLSITVDAHPQYNYGCPPTAALLFSRKCKHFSSALTAFQSRLSVYAKSVPYFHHIGILLFRIVNCNSRQFCVYWH